ncbi:hypothetical protein [Agrobacterium tumefaciens]|uniref:hypothetical protein n=1 Tax=Agrobacterium tumefaciens TaxID=358 RepID=UPI001111FCED
MMTISLTVPVVSVALQEAYEPVPIQANGTDEVCRLIVPHRINEPEYKRSFRSLKKLVSRFFSFEFVLAQQLLVQGFERLADLNIRHVRQCQFVRKLIQKFRSFSAVGTLTTLKHAFDGCNCRSSFPCEAYSAGSKAKRFVESREVHSPVLRKYILDSQFYASSIMARKDTAGVVINFQCCVETGGGSHARESVDISFSSEG